MAVSYIKTGTENISNSPTLSISITGIQAGDLVILGFSCSSSRTITDYDGFTELYATTNTGDSGYPSKSFLLTKVATGTSLTVAIDFDSDAYGTARYIVVRGGSVVSSSVNNLSSTGTTFPSTEITGINTTNLVAHFAFGFDASTGPGTWTAPTGYTAAGSNYYQYTAGHHRSMYVTYDTSPNASESPSASNTNSNDGRTIFLVNVGSNINGGLLLGFSF